jgi:hypothetical protein
MEGTSTVRNTYAIIVLRYEHLISLFDVNRRCFGGTRYANSGC